MVHQVFQTVQVFLSLVFSLEAGSENLMVSAAVAK
jgi:hypothetical protein